MEEVSLYTIYSIIYWLIVFRSVSLCFRSNNPLTIVSRSIRFEKFER